MGVSLSPKCQPKRGLGVLDSGLLLISWAFTGDTGWAELLAEVPRGELDSAELQTGLSFLGSPLSWVAVPDR